MDLSPVAEGRFVGAAGGRRRRGWWLLAARPPLEADCRAEDEGAADRSGSVGDAVADGLKRSKAKKTLLKGKASG